MAAGIERYPSGPIERYPSDLLMSMEADDVLVRESSMDSLYREFSLDPLQRDLSLDPLYRNESINADISLGLASAYPEGGNYVVTKDSRAFANPSVGDIAISTVFVAEMIPDDEGEDRSEGPVVQLDDGDFAKDVVAPVTSTHDYGVHIGSRDLSDTHFAGTNGVNDMDPMLDTLVSDTMSRVPTPEHSHEVISHLEKAGIVPMIIDRFTPTTTVRVVYDNNLEIQNGLKVMASGISKLPIVEIEGAFVMPGNLYTIMFIAHNEQDGERLHWLHVNYQGPQSITSAVARGGADVVHYEAPKATHVAIVSPTISSLAFLLFRQTDRLIVPVAHAQDEVSVRSFAATYHLIPVGALCFEVA